MMTRFKNGVSEETQRTKPNGIRPRSERKAIFVFDLESQSMDRAWMPRREQCQYKNHMAKGISVKIRSVWDMV